MNCIIGMHERDPGAIRIDLKGITRNDDGRMVTGEPKVVVERLLEMKQQAQVDEIVIVTPSLDRERRKASYAAIADAWLSRMQSGSFVATVAAVGTPPSSGNITNAGARKLNTYSSIRSRQEPISCRASQVRVVTPGTPLADYAAREVDDRLWRDMVPQPNGQPALRLDRCA